MGKEYHKSPIKFFVSKYRFKSALKKTSGNCKKERFCSSSTISPVIGVSLTSSHILTSSSTAILYIS